MHPLQTDKNDQHLHSSVLFQHIFLEYSLHSKKTDKAAPELIQKVPTHQSSIILYASYFYRSDPSLCLIYMYIYLGYISSSCKIIFGIHSFTGNFLPVSGHINHPSTKYTSNNTLCRLEIVASSKF